MVKSAEFRALYLRMWLSVLLCRKLDYESVDADEGAWTSRMLNRRKINRTVSINYGVYKDDMLAAND
jgi:hypothetical protein